MTLGGHGMPSARWLFLLLGLVLVLAAGCGGSSLTKAGSQRKSKPTVLTLTNFADLNEVTSSFADEVTRLSHGTLRIDLRSNPRQGEVAYETGLIRDVEAGKSDLGSAGSRAFDSVGVNSLRALNAPMLIDSYALQDEVLKSPFIGEMLQGLQHIGLVGLGVLQGPMRKPLGIARPLSKPADYSGLTIGTQQSRVADATMRAFGAKPVWFPAGADIKGLGFDGIEQQIGAIEGFQYEKVGHYLTANVNLWPRSLVLFANRKAFDSLTADQQAALRRAALNTLPFAAANTLQNDRDNSAILCRSGLASFVTASADDLAALRQAVQPVYHKLERDPQTKRFIEHIEAMRRKLAAPPAAAAACAPQARTAAPGARTPLDGVWRMITTFADDAGDPTPMAENYGTYTYVFDRSRFAFTQQYRDACTWGYGTYTIKGQHVAWTFKDGGGISPNHATNKPGDYFVFGWSLYRDQLTLRGSPAGNFRLKPWRLVSATPSRKYFSTRCPPPKQALP